MPRGKLIICADCQKQRKHAGRGICAYCHRRRKRHGTLPPLAPRPTIEQRLLAKMLVDEATGCWVWQAALTREGYGAFTPVLVTRGAHRVAYEVFIGEVPEGLQLDHLCRNRACINPDHLEPVTGRENTLRGVGPSAVHARKTHCKRGHLFDEKNTWPNGVRGRQCRACALARSRARYAARKSATANASAA